MFSLSAAVQMGSNLAVDFQSKITLIQTLKWTSEKKIKKSQQRWKIPKETIIFAPLTSFYNSNDWRKKPRATAWVMQKKGSLKKKPNPVALISPWSKSFSG